MTSKQEAADHRERKRLDRYGFDADPKSVRVHKDETPKHVCVRRLCGYVLQSAGRAWDEEVETPNGRIDVVDFGDFEEAPLAIEFETAPDQPTIEDKVERYVRNGPCRDVLPLDLRECPDSITGTVAWLEEELAGV